MIKRDLQKKCTRKLQHSYEKTYDNSLAVIRQHQASMQ